MYKLPQKCLSHQEWQNFFSQFSRECLIYGDFNAYNTIWGSPSTCLEGIKVFKACLERDLDILNDGSFTRFPISYSQGSAIDSSISNSPVLHSAHWEVINALWRSDHFPIKIEIFNQSIDRLRFYASYRIHSKKTDWSKIKDLLMSEIQTCVDLINNRDIDTQLKYSTFLTALTRKKRATKSSQFFDIFQ